ncbi:polymerase zeta subunit [Trichodelitschia bisporula]|uniref:DNA polymerase n=1 Tax=Trichodelitschia bisporula TaxID=703511 RepID=A0A6G1HNT5_9PEZI|nr:polymerase zeta subunit [Trichodelitschia bisporula]
MAETPLPQPFRFRLNCVDSYQTSPTPFDPEIQASRGLTQKYKPPVPIIRVFGATETGQKVCAHIHGAFPYVYVRYEGGLGDSEVRTYIQKLRLSINQALTVAFRRNDYNTSTGSFVAHISLVKGVPFFGYHVGYQFFFKVYLYNPSHTTRLADLLLQGAILARPFQPFESHLQFVPQWMIDYNLFGCDYIKCAKVRFRGPLPDQETLSTPHHKWHSGTVDPWRISDNNGAFARQSLCELEVDICLSDILNRHELAQRHLHQDFDERFRVLGADEKFVHSMAQLWRDEVRRRQRKMGGVEPRSSSSMFPPEMLVNMSAEARAESGGWIHEEEYREMLEGLMEDERREADVDFDGFFEKVPGEEGVQTAFESVEDLYPERLARELAEADLMTDEPDEELVHVEQVPLEPPEDDGYHSKEEEEEHVEEKGVGDEDEDEADDTKDEPSETHESNADVATSRRTPRTLKRAFTRDEIMQEVATIKKRRLFQSPSFNVDTSLSSGLGSAQETPRRVTFQLSGSQEDDGPPISSQLSQTSIKAGGSKDSKLQGFSVVKNPTDSESDFRLSQSDGKATPKTLHSRKSCFKDASSPVTPLTARSLQITQNPLKGPVSSQLVKAISQIPVAFSTSSKMYCFGQLPPSTEEITDTLLDYGIPPVIHQDAYYSNEQDVPDRAREYAGREFRLESNTVPFLPDFDPTGTSPATMGMKPGVVRDKVKEELFYSHKRERCTLRNWEIAAAPPTSAEVAAWLAEEKESKVEKKKQMPNVQPALSQIDGPTQSKGGAKFSQKQKSSSVQHEVQYMSDMSLEVHVNTRDDLVPDPAHDEISCVFWSVQAGGAEEKYQSGIVALSTRDGIAQLIARQTAVKVDAEENELDLLNRMVDIVHEHDPDILTGYEVHNSSWGYLIERARLKYELNICNEFSRMKSHSFGRYGKDSDSWGFNKTSTIHVTGRHVINIWRAMRAELNLLQYTVENVAFHLLHKRIPHYPFSDLTRWYQSDVPHHLHKTIKYFLSRVKLNLQILEANELISRTSEQARVLGVDFYSVFSRGSQFKVESLMFRIAKSENFMLVSPSRKQVAVQNALECIPLVMEPQSAFYSSPVVVLDFQSLYPSVMIAYNYCYSTCLGRVATWRGQNKLGFANFRREPGILELMKDHINVAPNGLMYVRPEMRQSLLAKMLGEILETRVMVKASMAADRDDKPLQTLLNNRQLALKFIANVTYGYTSASFSGRMPCAEIADSIVQSGRETLEKAIALIHSHPAWGAEVVYGDTDSLFVHLPGRTRDAAFTIGAEIAAAVTAANPRPIKLKFEKVYHPCVLLAKKRYVGAKYEYRNQAEPDFDAKGIETVRRDGTPAEQKIEERALKLLFRTADLSQVKSYVQAQFSKIMAGRVSVQDFVFAREVRLGRYSDKGPGPAGALIAARKMAADARREPQYGERVPYVVVTGAPGARLIDRCVAPEVLLQGGGMELDAEYYISKNIIPPLERIFNLVGANVRQWYDEMPRVQRVRASGSLGKTLEAYMMSTACVVCRTRLPQGSSGALCTACAGRPAAALFALRTRMGKAEKRVREVEEVCRSCTGSEFGEESKCDSGDCPVSYSRVKEKAGLRALRDKVGGVVQELEGLEW